MKRLSVALYPGFWFWARNPKYYYCFNGSVRAVFSVGPVSFYWRKT